MQPKAKMTSIPNWRWSRLKTILRDAYKAQWPLQKLHKMIFCYWRTKPHQSKSQSVIGQSILVYYTMKFKKKTFKKSLSCQVYNKMTI